MKESLKLCNFLIVTITNEISSISYSLCILGKTISKTILMNNFSGITYTDIYIFIKITDLQKASQLYIL